MAEARKCDRCSRYYTADLNDNSPDGKITAEFNISATSRGPFCAYSVDEIYDLCPNCYEDFKNFIKNKSIDSLIANEKITLVHKFQAGGDYADEPTTP